MSEVTPLPGFGEPDGGDASSEAQPEPPVTADPHRLLEDAEAAQREADEALDRLRRATSASNRVVRTFEERRRAVMEAVDAVTPEREVRTTEERRAAVLEIAHAEQEARERRRREEQARLEAIRREYRSATPEREIRSEEERRAAAQALVEEEFRRRKEAAAELNRRLEERRAAEASEADGTSGETEQG